MGVDTRRAACIHLMRFVVRGRAVDAIGITISTPRERYFDVKFHYYFALSSFAHSKDQRRAADFSLAKAARSGADAGGSARLVGSRMKRLPRDALILAARAIHYFACI